MVLGSVLNPVNSSILAVSLVPIGRDLGATPAQTAWLVSALYLATAVGQPVVGRLVDLLGPRPLYLVGTAMVGVAGVVGTGLYQFDEGAEASPEQLVRHAPQQIHGGAVHTDDLSAGVRDDHSSRNLVDEIQGREVGREHPRSVAEAKSGSKRSDEFGRSRTYLFTVGNTARARRVTLIAWRVRRPGAGLSPGRRGRAPIRSGA